MPCKNVGENGQNAEQILVKSGKTYVDQIPVKPGKTCAGKYRLKRADVNADPIPVKTGRTYAGKIPVITGNTTLVKYQPKHAKQCFGEEELLIAADSTSKKWSTLVKR